MLDYIKAKIAGYGVLFPWIEQELQNIERDSPEHHSLILLLQAKLVEARIPFNALREAIKKDNPSLTDDVLLFLYELEDIISLITSCYLPALQKERAGDCFLRQLFLPAAKRCGLDWIANVIIHLNGQHATFPRLFPEFPLILAPPQHAISLLEMPNLYHELGHHVFVRFPRIAEALDLEVSDHFAVERRRA